MKALAPNPTVVRRHPSGGWTHAVPIRLGTVRIYCGWWHKKRAAAAALASQSIFSKERTAA